MPGSRGWTALVFVFFPGRGLAIQRHPWISFTKLQRGTSRAHSRGEDASRARLAGLRGINDACSNVGGQ
jgi:hypothetical protein